MKNKSQLNRIIQERIFTSINSNAFFVVVPVLFLIFMFFRMMSIHFFYQEWYDPVYSYLMNGLTFALGSKDIGHIDHPGTPLQLFCAGVIKITSLFRGISDNDLTNDVIHNPELYIRIISWSLICINCAFLWLVGFIAFKRFGNRLMALGLQLLPLLSIEMVKYMPIVACESVIIFSSFAIVALLILYNIGTKRNYYLIIAIAFFSALSVSTKISSLVILVVPFFFLKGGKERLTYLFLTILIIFIFISPVISKMGNTISFIKQIFTHSGQYGSGKETIIDWGIYFLSLKKIVLKDIFFTLHLILLFVGWIFIARLKVNGLLRRLYIGLTLATTFQVIVVSRHYGFHYLIPVFALIMPLHGYFWMCFFHDKIVLLSPRVITLIIIIIIPAVFIRMVIKNEFQKGIVTHVEKTAQLVKDEMKTPFIILTENNSGGIFIEPALHFGLAYSGASIRNDYTKVVDKYYHGNYRWNSREGFCDWERSYLPVDLFAKFGKVYLYERNFKSEVPMEQILKMVDQTGMTDFLILEKVYENKYTHETIAMALVDTLTLKKKQVPALNIVTNAEQLSVDGKEILSTDTRFNFKGGELSSVQYAFSGEKSVMMTPISPYGLNLVIPTMEGKKFKAEIWQRNLKGIQAHIVASSKSNGIFYKASTLTDNRQGDWGKSELTFILPDDYPEKEIVFYVWNPSKDTIWVDDFSISVFP